MMGLTEMTENDGGGGNDGMTELIVMTDIHGNDRNDRDTQK